MTAIIIIIIAIIILIIYFYIRGQRRKLTGYTPYLEAIIALLEQNDNLAMKKFKEAVRIDSDLIDAYIKLGDLYRKKGDIEKAIQIHQSLTVRAILHKKIEKEVYFALARDFLEINRTNKAVSFLKEILKIDKNDKQARDLMLRIFEDMEDYTGCIGLYEDRKFKLKDDNRLAFYYASLANNRLKNLEHTDADREKEALNFFKKALKIMPSSLAALYHLANYFEQKGDLKKAKEYYLKFITHNPDYTFSIIPKFEKVYFELGLFNKIISIYEGVFNKNRKNFAVGIALANLFEKKNDIESAKNVYRKLTEKNPRAILPKLSLLRLSSSEESCKDDISKIEKIMDHRKFRCKKCGYEVDQFVFICPRCHTIESFLPYF